MNRFVCGALAITFASSSAVAWAAEDKPPPSPPDANVYVGPCVSPALNGARGTDEGAQAGILGILAGGLVPKLIGAGLDLIGNRLTALGADQKTTVFGIRASQANVDARTCIQLVRWRPEGQSLNTLLVASSLSPPSAVNQPLLSLTENLDFFVELWIRPSAGREAISLTPTLLYYPRPLGFRNLTRDTAITLSGSFTPATGSAASISWLLPRQIPIARLQSFVSQRSDPRTNELVRLRDGDLVRACEIECTLASPWIANPWHSEKKSAGASGTAVAAGVVVPGAGGLAPTPPTNVRVEVTEIRSGSRFFKALAEGFNAAKPAVQTNLEGLILEQTRANTEAQTQTASAAALVAFSSKLNDVEASRMKYCAGKGKSDEVIMALSADLSAKQTLANVAAVTAELDRPFPQPIGVSGTFVQSLCP